MEKFCCKKKQKKKKRNKVVDDEVTEVKILLEFVWFI